MLKATLALFATTALLFMTGCSSQAPVTPGTPNNPQSGLVPVGLTVTDDPPAGVAVLFFQLSITSASFQPGSVSLLSSANPIPVNVTQLQADSAFLGSTNVSAGTYTSLTLTFANPQLTIYNGTGSAIGACANNTVCQLAPTTTPLTLTFSSEPFPLTVAANTPVALQLDIHLNKIIQPDLSVNLAAPNGVSVSQLPSFPAGHPSSGLGHLVGTVQSLGTNQFTLLPLWWGQAVTINVNSSTTYNIPANAICGGVCNVACQGFGCLIVGDILKVRVSLQPDGSLLASEVDYIAGPDQLLYEGSIASLNTSGGNTTMNLILQSPPPSTTRVLYTAGILATVIVPPSGVTYSIDSSGFTIPSEPIMGSFTSAGNLLVGQEVTVSANGTATMGASGGLPGLTITANSIALETSQTTGQITSIDASSSSFQISPMASYFMPLLNFPMAPVNPVSLSVYATPQTSYDGLSPDSFSGLSVNNAVSVEGWLFPFTGASPACVPCAVTYGVVVAKSVRAQQNWFF